MFKRTVAGWNATRTKLKKQFERAGITFCELCGRSDYLSFAHAVKRRYITSQEELEKVALLCMSNADQRGCHDELEHGPPDVMRNAIEQIIRDRHSR